MTNIIRVYFLAGNKTRSIILIYALKENLLYKIIYLYPLRFLLFTPLTITSGRYYLYRFIMGKTIFVVIRIVYANRQLGFKSFITSYHLGQNMGIRRKKVQITIY